eukprot:8752275-Pyramimonas_sp.AAC.1
MGLWVYSAIGLEAIGLLGYRVIVLSGHPKVSACTARTRTMLEGALQVGGATRARYWHQRPKCGRRGAT